MNNTEAREKIIAIITEKKKVSPTEINYITKGKIATVQIYGIAKKLAEEGVIAIEEADKNKFYSLAEKKKEQSEAKEQPGTEAEKTEEKKPSRYSVEKSKRDFSKYRLNGGKETFNKGRLAHAIIAQAAKDKRLSLKGALELFDPEGNAIPPYGLIKPIAEAKKLSVERLRFFIKPEEEIKLRDATIAVSNQFTPERINRLIEIARKELKYKIQQV